VSDILDKMLLNETLGRTLTQNLNFNRGDFLKSLLDPRRDIDDECGFPKDPVRLEVYQRLYDRHPIANRYITIMDTECWQETPPIYDDENPDVITGFEDAVLHLGDNLQTKYTIVAAEENFYDDEDGGSTRSSPISSAGVRRLASVSRYPVPRL